MGYIHIIILHEIEFWKKIWFCSENFSLFKLFSCFWCTWDMHSQFGCSLLVTRYVISFQVLYLLTQLSQAKSQSQPSTPIKPSLKDADDQLVKRIRFQVSERNSTKCLSVLGPISAISTPRVCLMQQLAYLANQHFCINLLFFILK